MGNAEKVLLVNGMWRAGTTYFWSKIRENTGWRCFYEPLHEVLSVYHPSRNDDNMREEVWRMMRHPSMTVGYFHEYQLAEAGVGVPGYTAPSRMSALFWARKIATRPWKPIFSR